MKKGLYYGLIVIFAAIFLFCGWNILSYYLNAQSSSGLYDDLAQQMEDAKNQEQPPVYFTRPTEPEPSTEPLPTDPDGPTEETTEPTEPTETTPPVILAEYASLYLENTDMVGWIKISGTNINYPVMQTPDYPDYYLKRNFQRRSSDWGCIYVEEKCDVFEPSDNLTIYGHHMYDGSMFTALMNYTSRYYQQQHPYIQFDTLLERHTYEIIAVFKTSASVGKGFPYHTFVDAETPEEFNEFVANCKKLSLYNIEATAEYGDKLITLSTCEYSQTNGRLVVVAKRIGD